MAFDALNVTITSVSALALFDFKKIAMTSADALSCGIAVVLRQKQSDNNYCPVAYESRTVYAQIKKEECPFFCEGL